VTQKGYSLPTFVEDLHEGANVLLAYWHYYRTDEDLEKVECIDRHRSRLADLGAEQFSFVRESCRLMRAKSEFCGGPGMLSRSKGAARLHNTGSPIIGPIPLFQVSCSCLYLRRFRGLTSIAGEKFKQAVNWDDEHYWACRMFDQVWSPGESFRS
jgi:hypothetical protein